MKVFEKNKLGHMELSNRIGVPAMCTYMVKTKDGVGNLHHVAHYDPLAKGRPAFIVQEATAVNAHGYINDECLGIFTPRQRQILKEIVDCVHAYGVNIGIQLNHAGMKNTFGNQKYGPMEQGDVISLDEDGINELIVNFEFASRWARELGYDFVEVHAAHGYLINQFLSPLTNQRSDAYGQDRTLLLRRIVEGCRDNFEGDIVVRISAEEYEAGGLHPEDMKSTVQVIEEAGAAAISVSSGGLNTGAVHAYPLYQIPYAETIRTMTTLPVMGVGCITKESEISQILQEERCDYVLLGRKLLRDPFFLLKWQDELGLLREEEIGQCLYRGIHMK